MTIEEDRRAADRALTDSIIRLTRAMRREGLCHEYHERAAFPSATYLAWMRYNTDEYGFFVCCNGDAEAHPVQLERLPFEQKACLASSALKLRADMLKWSHDRTKLANDAAAEMNKICDAVDTIYGGPF